MAESLAHRGPVVLLGMAALAVGLFTSACSSLNSAADSVGNLMLGGNPGPQAGQAGYVKGFLGGVVADEPRAALAGRQVLSSGGNAADAAVAMGLMLSVTLPSRAGLGGGGACLAYDPGKSSINQGVPEALLFLPPPGGAGGERPAAVPTMARGLYALGARYGQRPFEQLSIAAEQGARFGQPVSRAFARDLAVVAGPLAGDPQARALFLTPDGAPLPEGAMLRQPDLAGTLGQMRAVGVGDFYNGAMARKMVAAAQVAGGGLSESALRGALPQWVPALMVPGPDGDQVAFLPPPADGGLAAAAAFKALAAAPQDLQGAQQRALAVAAAWRKGGADAQALLDGPAPAATPGALPASTAFMAMDREGRVVTCAVSMNNLFGTGRIAPGTGVVLAASPSWAPQPLLAAAIGFNTHLHAFHAAATGSGQEGAPFAAADGIWQALNAKRPVLAPANWSSSNNGAIDFMPQSSIATSTVLRVAPEPGRANVMACGGYLPDEEDTCGWTVDPRVAGLAIGSN